VQGGVGELDAAGLDECCGVDAGDVLGEVLELSQAEVAGHLARLGCVSC
jgi:hypothetical protein